MSKIQGIDSRQIKCCNKSPSTIEAGISFDEHEDNPMLCFHFLQYSNGRLIQTTKSMMLNKENTRQLIKELQTLKFKK